MRTLRQRLLVVTSVLGLAFSANAQQFPSCPLTFNGPDVIVGDVGEAGSPNNVIQNYNANATIDAVALASTSCNVGNSNLNWIQNTVNHPLIGGSMYKYKTVNGSGRFEQIGNAWMKHAFAAFQQTLCCSTCTGSGLQQFLQPGCSDPYTAARNGTVAMLGPKYQVNPNTGAYLASHPTPSGGGNTGRVEMLLTDLEASSASVRYFGEVAYVALDDARQNNNDNNASHREFSVAVGTATQAYNFDDITGSLTVRMAPALQAWQTVDPGVTINTIITPEDSIAPYDGNGKMVLGSRVTNLGGGIWHYEYALYNMNSDRAVASFRVPVAANVVVSNIGFHDVAYRGGDGEGGVNRDGTDWPGAKTATEVGWATTPFATNANANALRFSTTYNFRFDANAAPTTGSITVGQFKVVNDVVVPNVDVPGLPPAFDAFCTNGSLGTDHTTACPCGNTGLAGNGCAHSFDAGGANIAATGTPSLDNVQLTTTFEPSTSFTLFMQHDAAGDTVFHDGVLCAGGTLVRLRGRAAAGGSALFPDSSFAVDATLTLSQRGGVTVGSGARRYYAAWFRNASTTFCPPATANVTNGWMIDW